MKHISFCWHAIAVAILLGGCAGQKQAGPRPTLFHHPVDLGGNYLGVGGFLAYCDGSVVGLEMSPASKQPFFNLPRDSAFYFFGNKGRGPGEFLWPFSIQYVGDGTVGVTDVQTSTYSEFAIPREGGTPTVGKEIEFPRGATRVIKTAFDRYIYLSSLSEKMFSLADPVGAPIGDFIEYPYRNATERRDASRSMAYQGTVSANPSRTKFVYSSFFGEIIHFYSIEEGGIGEIAKIEKEHPVYKGNDDGTQGVGYGGEGIYGYVASYATDSLVYAIFDGRKMSELREGEGAGSTGKLLRVFDWSGNLVKEYGLDVPCGFICVSDDDETMWAVATESGGETVLARFDLKNGAGSKQAANVTYKPQPKGTPYPGGAPVPETTVHKIDVRTSDNERNRETQKVLDSIMNLPGVTLDLRSNERYDVRVDTLENSRTIVLMLK
ncbi:MAG: TolB-like 6-bladed beta-propeller domain-containing protein [Alistipes sp.]|jgi:hypothetical protein|nr:TolB-like 6-bladed beta-propeller domain-containing protein [Alistipes sp.]